MYKFLTIVLLFSLSSVCYADLAPGDQVIYTGPLVAYKGKVLEIQGNQARVDFGNPESNARLGLVSDVARRLTKYSQISILTYQYSSAFCNCTEGPYTIKIGDRVIYTNIFGDFSGKVVDLTENGYSLVQFDDRFTNGTLGKMYHITSAYLRPQK